MELFAHNGVNHASGAEALAHSTGEVVLITLAITLAAAVLMATATFVLRRLGWIEILINDKEK